MSKLGKKKYVEEQDKKKEKKHVLHFLMSQAMLSFMFHFMSYIIQSMKERRREGTKQKM